MKKKQLKAAIISQALSLAEKQEAMDKINWSWRRCRGKTPWRHSVLRCVPGRDREENGETE